MENQSIINRSSGSRYGNFLFALILAALLFLSLCCLGERPSHNWRLLIATGIFLTGFAVVYVSIKQHHKSSISIIDILVFILAAFLILRILLLNEAVDVKPLYLLNFSILLYCLFRITAALQKGSCETIIVIIVSLISIFETTLGILQALSIVQPRNEIYHITGSFLNPGPYACFLAATGTVSMSYCIKAWRNWSESKPKQKLLLICISASVVLTMCIVGITKSRSAILGYAVCLLLFALRNTHVKSTTCVVFLIICSIAFITALYFAKRDSADGRILINKVSVMAINKSNLMGAGFGYFKKAYGESQHAYFANSHYSSRDILVAGSPRYAFNEYLQLGVEVGILPMLLFIIITVLSIIVLIKNNTCIAYGQLSLAISSIFSYPLQTLPNLLLFVLYLCYTSIQISKIRVRTIYYALCPICVIIISVIMMRQYSKYIYALEKYDLALSLFANEIVEPAIRILDSVSEELPTNEEYLFEFGHILHKLGYWEVSNVVLARGARVSDDPMFHNIMGKNFAEMGQFSDAEEEYYYAKQMLPNRLYPLYLLSMLYYNYGMMDKFNNMANEAIDFMPKISSPITDSLKADLILLLNNIEDESKSEINNVD